MWVSPCHHSSGVTAFHVFVWLMFIWTIMAVVSTHAILKFSFTNSESQRALRVWTVWYFHMCNKAAYECKANIVAGLYGWDYRMGWLWDGTIDSATSWNHSCDKLIPLLYPFQSWLVGSANISCVEAGVIMRARLSPIKDDSSRSQSRWLRPRTPKILLFISYPGYLIQERPIIWLLIAQFLLLLSHHPHLFLFFYS